MAQDSWNLQPALEVAEIVACPMNQPQTGINVRLEGKIEAHLDGLRLHAVTHSPIPVEAVARVCSIGEPLQQHGGSPEEQDVRVQEKQPVGFQVGKEIKNLQRQVVRSPQRIASRMIFEHPPDRVVRL